ncbi:MAG: hypothetical protein HY347_01705 [candidate division NC10 bacterium]|nr:hypothetical protein [candidate division NC10 bacterium]
MRKIGFLVGILVVLGLFLGVQEQAWAQIISGSGGLPTIKGETPAFTAKGFEFFLTGAVSLDMAYDTNDVGGYENNVTSVPIRGVDTFREGSDTFHATAAASPLGFGIKGPGLWGGTGRAYFEFDMLGVEGGVTCVTNINFDEATSQNVCSENTGTRVKLAFAQLGWPHSQTGIGDVTLTFGKAVQPSILLAAEVPEDPAVQGFIFSWAPQLGIGTSIPMGKGNALNMGFAAVDPPNGVFGFGSNLKVTGVGSGQTGAANYSGIPILDGSISFSSDFLGRINYYGGLVPFTLGVGGFYGREEFKVDQFSSSGPIGMPAWLVSGNLILPILGTKTDKRAGTLGVKVNVWHGENTDAYLGNMYHGAFVVGEGACTGVSGAVAIISCGDFDAFPAKGTGAWTTIQWFPGETVMLWTLLAGVWEDELPVGVAKLDGSDNFTQEGRSLYAGLTKNFNVSLSTTLMFRYLYREKDENTTGGILRRGESYRVLWDWSYAF